MHKAIREATAPVWGEKSSHAVVLGRAFEVGQGDELQELGAVPMPRRAGTVHRHTLSFLPVRSETTLPRPHSSKGQGRSPCGWEGPKAQKGCPSDIAFGPPAAQCHWRCVAAVPGDWSSKDLRDICEWPEGRWGSPFKTSAMWTRRPHVKRMLGGRSGPFSRGSGDR